MKKDKNHEVKAAKLEQDDQTSKLIASLQESLQRYETLLDDLDVYIGETDLEGNITFVNDAGCRLAELSRRKLIGINYKAYMDPKTAERVYKIYEQIYNTGIPVKSMIFEAIDKYGRRRTVDQSVSLIRNAQGVITGFRNVSLDITGRKEAEDKLRESETRYRLLADNMTDAVWMMDMNLNVIYASPSVEKLIGYTNEEIKQRTPENFLTPESLNNAMAVFSEEVVKAKADPSYSPIRTLELEFRRKDGTTYWSESTFSFIRDENGIPVSILAEGRDITDRKETEDKLAEHRSQLEAIFSSVQDAIITIDPNFIVIEANKSLETICGIAVKEIAGREFSQCQKNCSKACQEVLKQTLEKKAAVKEYRIECERHQQHPQQVVSVSSSPLLDPQDKFMGAVLVIRDITILRDIERGLRERSHFQNLIGRNKTMQDIYSLLEDLANLDTSVLVTGESGTGKELVARALHYSGNRAFKPFVTVNCSALAESLLESELFGHVRGAFTGAVKDKQGRFQAADGGTILLDEIGDISPMIQLKLLRVLQEKEFEHVGSSIPHKIDVRVIACTNKDLNQKVNRGEFRQDLYYRLKVVEVALPPLRQRLEDLPLLVDHFRLSFNDRFNKNVKEISPEVLDTFMNYSWPGNVRELEHVMEHAFVLCHGATITAKHLPVDIRNFEHTAILHQIKTKIKESNRSKDILDALNKTGWNKAKAARLLGISRQTIYRKIDTQQRNHK
jgi:two-component system, NtrC family, response regulator HydG